MNPVTHFLNTVAEAENAARMRANEEGEGDHEDDESIVCLSTCLNLLLIRIRVWTIDVRSVCKKYKF